MSLVSLAIPFLPRGQGSLFANPAKDLTLEEGQRLSVAVLDVHVANVFESVHAQLEELHYYGLCPAHLLMGRNFFKAFQRSQWCTEKEFRDMVPYTRVEIPGESLNEHGPRLFVHGVQHYGWLGGGISLHLVPWMLGSVVLPKIDPVKLLETRPGVVRVNDWAISVSNQLVGIAAEAIRPREDLEIGRVKKVLLEFREAFNRWVEKPSKKPFLRV